MTDALPDADISAELAATVKDACDTAGCVYINGGGSKRQWLGRRCDAPDLDVAEHRGIVDYEPTELVVTARAGTTISELQALLARENQTLASEPPELAGRATLGGTVACNLSGPARPWGGSIRDAVLGVRLINGRGELLRFGGTVMKNVAGYDISRLQAGALGSLAVLCDISLRCMPLPEHTLTLQFESNSAAAVKTMNRHAGQPGPLSAACWLDGKLYLRLSGAASAVEHTARQWGGETLPDGAAFWRSLMEFELPFFQGDSSLWRCSLSSTAAPTADENNLLIDWGGAQHWLRGEQSADEMHRFAASNGGHACLFRGGDRVGEVRSRLSGTEEDIQARLKHAFDPNAVLNPGRLYAWM